MDTLTDKSESRRDRTDMAILGATQAPADAKTTDNYAYRSFRSAPLQLTANDAHADALVARYAEAAHAENTLRAYAVDLADFNRWGGRLPALPNEVAQYLAERASSLRPATLRRRLAGLAAAHRDIGQPDPASSVLVRKVRQVILMA